MSRRPRLLVVASTYPATAGDGTPAFVRDLAHAVAEGFDTLVVVPRVPGAATREQDGPVTVERFRYFPRRWEDLAHGAILENLRARRSRWLQVPPFLLAEVVAMRRAVRRHRPDVVHVHWVVPQGVAALVGARGVPWLVTTLGGDVYGLRDPLSRALKSRVLRRAGAVTTMNADMRERLVALGAPPERTSVLPMGADLDSVRAATAGVTPEAGALLFVGRLAEKKGVPVLLEALRRLPADLDWSLDVIGDGPLQQRLEKLAAGLPVRFLGRRGRAELSAALARASVVVVPSVPTASGDQDGLPVALLEAMGSGTAVVASRLPGIDEAIEDGVSGLLVPPGDPDALAAALTRVLTDDDLRERLGRAASQAAEDHSVSAVGRRYVEVLRAVAAGR
jgi:colanic acid/amylovoran biosynthesis glycosyltransferase